MLTSTVQWHKQQQINVKLLLVFTSELFERKGKDYLQM